MRESDVGQAGRHVDALVIGAGFSGLYMLHRLRDLLGLNAVAVDTAPSVGGTWYWNRYPGARCDTESYVYCYSFSAELLTEWNWSGRYAERDEILGYLEHVADRFDLRRSIALGVHVTEARWDDALSRWLVSTDNGPGFAARFLVTATGILTAAPYVPDILGAADFEGAVHHTRDWPQPTPDLGNKAVGVIGTGSTGAQMVPRLAQQAGRLVVFQRTAQFMVPAQDHVVDNAYLAQVKQDYDAIWNLARWSVAGMPWGNNGRSAWGDTAEQRKRTWDELWAQGGQRFMQQNYKDALTDPAVSDMVSEYVRGKIRERVHDPAVAERLTPRTYPIGGRRTVVESGYFETFNRSNVELIDVATDPVERLVTQGVRLASGRVVALDILIFATGFDAVTGPLLKIDFRGRDGASLRQLWADGPSSYLGMAVSGFPNLFMITGPGSTFGNHAVLMEHQVEWISGAIATAVESDSATVEASADAQKDWMQWVDQTARTTVQFGTKSWFNGSNIPGKPESTYVYLGSYRRYRKICDDAAAQGYGGLQFVVREAVS